ncbi:hypothetical protein DFH06DRAFT_1348680 [Mycena polygramma]|nr:hypothetical protein DFH06DRAFT_1348680 [Mycena polygramma]
MSPYTTTTRSTTFRAPTTTFKTSLSTNVGSSTPASSLPTCSPVLLPATFPKLLAARLGSPSNQKTPITTTLGTAGHQLQLQKYPAHGPPFQVVPEDLSNPTREIFKPVLELLRDPGFSCIECILSNYYCEFRGFNHPCTACESKAHKACSFKYSEAQLERARLELAPWIDTGTRQTLYMIAELHASMVRATIAHQAACFETQEMADKLAALQRARRRGDQVVKQSARLDPKHVATFNPDRTAHYGVTDSGAGPSSPTFSQVAGGSSGDGDDGLDLGQEALVPPTSRSSTPGGEEVVSLETEDPIEEEVVPEVEEEAAVTPSPVVVNVRPLLLVDLLLKPSSSASKKVNFALDKTKA